MATFTYLALGDSYSIGEQVLLTESFPYQAIQLLRQHFIKSINRTVFAAPEIVAKTGWTTDELSSALGKYTLSDTYDFVSLLIGVNNQYRGRNAESFKPEFSELLRLAVRKAGNDPRRVAVLSIPDWGATPFADDRDKNTIAMEIDSFNAVCGLAANEFYCHYINITDAQRKNASNEAYLASDKLHPSALEYGLWAQKLAAVIKEGLD